LGINILAVATLTGKSGEPQIMLKVNTLEPGELVDRLNAAGHQVAHLAVGGATSTSTAI
jgi:hypothetical protein